MLYILGAHISPKDSVSGIFWSHLRRPLINSQLLEGYNSGIIQGVSNLPKTEQTSLGKTCQVSYLDEFLKQRFL